MRVEDGHMREKGKETEEGREATPLATRQTLEVRSCEPFDSATVTVTVGGPPLLSCLPTLSAGSRAVDPAARCEKDPARGIEMEGTVNVNTPGVDVVA